MYLLSWLQLTPEGELPIHLGSRMIFSTVNVPSWVWANPVAVINSKDEAADFSHMQGKYFS